jgi:hypothetical protein
MKLRLAQENKQDNWNQLMDGVYQKMIEHSKRDQTKA